MQPNLIFIMFQNAFTWHQVKAWSEAKGVCLKEYEEHQDLTPLIDIELMCVVLHDTIRGQIQSFKGTPV